MINLLLPTSREKVLELIGSSGMFSLADMGEIETRIDEYFNGSVESIWIVDEDNNKLNGVLYCIPEPMTNGTWNILMLVVREDAQGKGVGRALMKEVQKLLIDKNARLLIVETSGTSDFVGARSFYNKCGFTEIAKIPNFYDLGDDKIVLVMQLSANC